MNAHRRILVLLLCGLACGGCEYAKLLRPSVLKQLDPDVVRLVNELPEVDHPNKEVVARLFAHGGLGHAQTMGDGSFRADIRVPEGEYIWRPSIIVMPHAGDLELVFSNEDSFSHHAAYVQSNGGRMTVPLAVHESGSVRVQLDGPGMYWFGCPVSNHATRGMLGLVLVGGESPREARLDRPAQSRVPVVPIRSNIAAAVREER